MARRKTQQLIAHPARPDLRGWPAPQSTCRLCLPVPFFRGGLPETSLCLHLCVLPVQLQPCSLGAVVSWWSDRAYRGLCDSVPWWFTESLTFFAPWWFDHS
jgi:hypothetical protein